MNALKTDVKKIDSSHKNEVTVKKGDMEKILKNDKVNVS